ncbi:IS110 family transposase [Salinispora arenicola]|uniref:IS110 family transposase n=1 Tax=Salinispora arenicola TaxID=168697 RepID=UPI003FD7882E
MSCPRCPSGACAPCHCNERQDEDVSRYTCGSRDRGRRWADTHQETHTAAMIDLVGRVLDTEQFRATASGYAALLAWMHRHGRLSRVRVEGTGAYSAGLVRLLRDEQVQVIEVDRPDRKTRRFQGKSDPIDTVQAARAALAGERTHPKQGNGQVEALRNLRVTQRSAVDQRADAAIPAVAVALRSLARRHQHLSTEIANLDELLEPLVAAINPALLAANSVGPDVTGQLLISAGENHDRLASEAAFAMPCGAAPIPATSGKTTRHRLDRDGDRQANAALYRVVLVWLR